MSVEFPARIKLAQLPTPLLPLRRLQRQSGGPLIWLKCDDRTGALLSGNKVRKLEFILAKALEDDCDAVITCGGLQSNHCRATALAAAQLGLECHLILRGLPDNGDAQQGNLLLDHLAGASISYHKPQDYFSNLNALLEARCSAYQRENKKALVIPTGGSDGVGIWGYLAAFAELKDDFKAHDISPSHLVCATGSGGTQAGLVLGAACYDPSIKVFGINVCDTEQWFIDKINRDIDEWSANYPVAKSALMAMPEINVIDGYVGAGYAKANDDVYKVITELAALEGVVLDPVYTGKAFDGLLKEIASGRFEGCSDIVFIHTGGVFGLFPYAMELGRR